MDIGKNIGSQTNKLVINLEAHTAMRKSLNILRKPQIDAGNFDSGNDGTGWYINGRELTQEEQQNYIDKSIPFQITPNFRDPGVERIYPDTTTNRYVSVSVNDGTWHRITGYDGNTELEINETESASFTKAEWFFDEYLETDAKSYQWTTTLGYYDDPIIYYFWLELRDADSNFSGINPSILVLQRGLKSSIPEDPSVDDDGIQHYVKVIGKVRVESGVMTIWQYWENNIKDQHVLPDSVGQQDIDDARSFIKTIGYADANVAAATTTADVSNVSSYNQLQDFNAVETLLLSDNTVEYDGDKAIAFYDIVKAGSAKKVTKQYSRIDSNDADERTAGGKSLEIVTNATAEFVSDGSYTQIYHFFEPNPIGDADPDITQLTSWSNVAADNDFLLVARDVKDDPDHPRIHYLDVSNVASKFCEFDSGVSSTTITTSSTPITLNRDHYIETTAEFAHDISTNTHRVNIKTLQPIIVQYTVRLYMQATGAGVTKDSMIYCELKTNTGVGSSITTVDTVTEAHLFCNNLYSRPAQIVTTSTTDAHDHTVTLLDAGWPAIQFTQATITKSVIFKPATDLYLEATGERWLWISGYVTGNDVTAKATLNIHTL